MTEQQLRELVRDAIRRHVAPGQPAAPPREAHASHWLLPVHPGSAIDGMCVIEPAVRCTHCGYCQSFGH